MIERQKDRDRKTESERQRLKDRDRQTERLRNRDKDKQIIQNGSKPNYT